MNDLNENSLEEALKQMIASAEAISSFGASPTKLVIPPSFYSKRILDLIKNNPFEIEVEFDD